eukprot:8654357-Alexandrium_andersonii.AAC.1
MVPGPSDELVQRCLDLWTSSCKMPGPLDELVHRCQDLWTSSCKGAWTFGRARTKVPGPLDEL